MAVACPNVLETLKLAGQWV